MKKTFWALPWHGFFGQSAISAPKKIEVDDLEILDYEFSGDGFRNFDDIPELPWKMEHYANSPAIKPRWTAFLHLKTDRSADGADWNQCGSSFLVYLEQIDEPTKTRLFNEAMESMKKHGDPLKGSCT